MPKRFWIYVFKNGSIINMQPSWGKYITNLCHHTSQSSFQEQKLCIPQTNKTTRCKLLGMEFFLDHGENTFTLREPLMTTTFFFCILFETEYLQQHWTGAVLTQQWKCHPLRQEHHFLQYPGFLWRSPIKILNVSICSEYFPPPNCAADQITAYYKTWYWHDNEQILLTAVPFKGKRTFPFIFVVL